MTDYSEIDELKKILNGYQQTLLDYEVAFQEAALRLHEGGPKKWPQLTDEDYFRESVNLLLHIDEESRDSISEAIDQTLLIPDREDKNRYTFQLPMQGPWQPGAVTLKKIQQYRPVNYTLQGERIYFNSDCGLRDLLRAALLIARFPFLIKENLDTVDLDLSEGIPADLPYPFRRFIFNGIILGRKPSAGLRFLDRAGLLDVFIPELTAGKGLTQNRFHAHDIYDHLLNACDGAHEADLYIRWSALLHDIGKVPTRRETPSGEATFHNHEVFSAKMMVPVMKRLGIPRSTGEKIRFLVRNHMFHYTNEWTDKAVRRFMKSVSEEELDSLIRLRLADRKGSGKKSAFPKALKKLMDHIEEVKQKEAEPKVTDLAINGHDLMQIGFKPGRKMGDFLKETLDRVLAEEIENEKETLLEQAEKFLQNSHDTENKNRETENGSDESSEREKRKVS